MASPTEAPHAPSALRSRRLKDLPRTVALSAVLLLVSLVSAFFLSPGLSARQVPELSPEDLGRPFRASSLSGFKASRDFEVLDDSSNGTRREAARAGVRPVFDYEPGVEPRVVRSVREAFGAMQEVAAESFQRRGLVADPQWGRRGSKESREDPELSTELRSERRRFENSIVAPDDGDYEALVQSRFPADAEQAVVALIENAYRAKIVASREELSRVDVNGITVRVLGGTGESEMATAAPAVLDLREASVELERFASVPGNLLPDAAPALRRAVLRLAARQVRANLTVNIAETESRRRLAAESVKPVTLVLKKGQRIIGDGELVNQTHLVVVQSLRSQLSELDMLQVQVGGVSLVALLVAVTWLFFSASLRRFNPTKRDAIFMGLMGVSLLGLLQVWMQVGDAVHDRFRWVPIEAVQFAFPVAAGAMLVRFVLSEEHALYFAVVFSALAGLMLGSSLSFFVFTLLSSLLAAHGIAKARDRAGIFRAGARAGFIGFALVVFQGFAAGKGFSAETWASGLLALGALAIAAPMVVLSVTPVVESVFGYASDLKLLELANLNHPALKELVLQAPGTYHHSIIMGSLVEAAAESIGANPLLARSCAYYHDIGKGRNPAYFAENQKGENPHDALAPAMSAAIIKRHVTDGLELAREHKLPRRVADAIPQHHGTRAVGFFLHKAQKAQEGKTLLPGEEQLFHYPGPRPESREAALVMIADAVEAASRSMTEPTEARLRALVQRLINLMFSEGQLDECELTLKDLSFITDSFARTLEGIYHARPAYPPGALGDGRASSEEVVAKPLAVVRSLDAKKAGRS